MPPPCLRQGHCVFAGVLARLGFVASVLSENLTTSPKVHLSSQATDGAAGAHAGFIDVRDATAFLEVVPPLPFDCMLEAKEKDRALLQLRDELSARGIVEAHVRSPP